MHTDTHTARGMKNRGLLDWASCTGLGLLHLSALSGLFTSVGNCRLELMHASTSWDAGAATWMASLLEPIKGTTLALLGKA